MKTLYVYADFDWLDEPMLVGELGYESQGHRDRLGSLFRVEEPTPVIQRRED